jgi:tetratricopeptide (TPR) repeat protein
VWASTAAAFDRYAQHWLGAQRAVCEATRVRHVQSAELLDRRMECLATRRRSLAAAAQVLQQRPGPAAVHAGELLATLVDIEPCADTAVLLELSGPGGGPAPPVSSARAAQAAGVRQQLASAAALVAAGDVAAAEPAVAEAERRAAGQGDGALDAELLYAQGRLRLARGEVAAAVGMLRRAGAQAVSSHDDELPVDAWLTLATATGSLDQDRAEAESWLGQAEAWMHRLGHGSDSRRIALDRARAGLQRRAGDAAGAVATLSRAIDAAEALWGKGDPRLIALLCDRAAAQGERHQAGPAAADAERAVALGTAAWGPEHPATRDARSVLASLRSPPRP